MEGEGNSRAQGRREEGNASQAARSLVMSCLARSSMAKGKTLDIEIWVRDKIARKEVIAVRQDTASVSHSTSK